MKALTRFHKIQVSGYCGTDQESAVAKPTVLVLHNEPLLPKNHPDADSEHAMVGVAKAMADILAHKNFTLRSWDLPPTRPCCGVP